MKRAACVLLLAGLATACSTSGRDAASTLNRPFPGFGRQDPSVVKRQYEKVVKDDPSDKYGWYNLGVIAQSVPDTDSATADYSKALRIDPHFEAALYNYGLLRYNATDYPTAITYLRRAVRENALDANALWYLGLALRIPHTKETDRQSTHYLNAALKLNPALAQTLKLLSGSGGSGARSR